MRLPPLAPVLIIVVLVASAMARFPIALIITEAVIGFIAWYGYSVRRRPQRPCWWCKGRGVTEGYDPETKKFRAPVGRCPVCRNAKVLPRWGTVIFDRDARQAIRASRTEKPKTKY